MGKREDRDAVKVFGTFLNFVENERVRSYNEGVDAERERCAKIALACDSKRGNEKQIAKAIREQS